MNSFVRLAPALTGKKVQSHQNTIGGNVVQAQTASPIDATGWTDSRVRVATGTGKKMQTFQNTVAGNVVHALAVVAVNTSGVPLYG